MLHAFGGDRRLTTGYICACHKVDLNCQHAGFTRRSILVHPSLTEVPRQPADSKKQLRIAAHTAVNLQNWDLNSSLTSARNDIFLVSHLYYFSSDEHRNKCIPSHLEKYHRGISSYTKLHTSLRGSSLISNPTLPLSVPHHPRSFCFTVVFIKLLNHFFKGVCKILKKAGLEIIYLAEGK